MFVMAAIAIIGTVMSFMSASDAAKAQEITNKANAEAQNITRESNNVLNAKKASLSNYMRTYENNQKLKAFGSQYSAAGQQMVRNADEAVNGKLQRSIQASEALGTGAAAIGAMGVVGSTVDAINQTNLLRNREIEQQFTDKDTYANYDYLAQRNGMISNTVNSFDNSLSFGNIDRSVNVPAFVAKPSALAYGLKAAQQAYGYISATYAPSTVDTKTAPALQNTNITNPQPVGSGVSLS